MMDRDSILPVIQLLHMADLVSDVSTPVDVCCLHDVLEDLVLALQHGAVVGGAGEERAVNLVALFHNLSEIQNGWFRYLINQLRTEIN